ncbi:twin-arginine translocase subunit TatC [Candidatus Latescibacterota bacterium]
MSEDTPPEQSQPLAEPATGDAVPTAPGEMPFLDHLEELRWRILKSLGVVLVGAAVSFAFSDPILKVLTRPYDEAVQSILSSQGIGPVAAIQEWLEQLRYGVEAAPPTEAPAAEDMLPQNRQLQSLKPMTYFFVSLEVALLGGLILALPVVFYQFWRFVAPGLLSREKRTLLPIVGLSVVCFGLGALVAYGIVLPIGLRFFLSLEPADMTSQWAVDEYISFVLRLLLGFGIVFEMPVVTLFLSRLGLVTPAYLRRIRRYAIVVIFVMAAIFTPPDPLSQILMALPLLGLYEVSILICIFTHRRRAD